jgi:uncharacterized protein YbjT (DUF2867 family)
MLLVTGASGYVGSHIVKRLAESGPQVRAMVRNRSWAEAEGRLAGLKIDWVEGDVTKPETLKAAMQGVDTVIHTVAIAIEKGGRKYETINTQGTVNVVDAAKAAGVKRFINLSQLGADSKLPYRFLASKGRAQEYVAASGLAWTAFRPSVVWGPEDEFANSFAKLLPISPLIYPIIGNGKAAFQSIWVEDLVTAIVKSIDDASLIGQDMEVAGPEVLTIEEIERRTLKAKDAHRLMVRTPIFALRIIVGLMGIVLPAPPVTNSLIDLLAVNNTAPNNMLTKFVAEPKAFTVENIAPYMRQFKFGATLRQFFGRPIRS